jgi:diguanylate cyclase (GGDEF)-like protein
MSAMQPGLHVTEPTSKAAVGTPSAVRAAADAEPRASPVAQALLDALPFPAWLADRRTRRVTTCNESAQRTFGRSEQALLQAHSDTLVTSPEDEAWWCEAAAAIATGDGSCAAVRPLYGDTSLAMPDGRLIQVTRSMRAVAASGVGDAHEVLVVLVDRSAEYSAQMEREALLAELQATLEATADGILVTDTQGRIRAFNRRFAAVWSLPAELQSQRDDQALQQWVSKRMAGTASTLQSYRERWQQLHLDVDKTESARIDLLGGGVLECVTRPLWRGGVIQGRVWSFRDLTEQVAARQQIENLSRRDVLTGLPNRQVLAEQVVERLGQQGEQSRPTGHSCESPAFALLMVDLDRFAQVNDGMGQAVGDYVLREVAERLGACLREGDHLARLGADQFAVLVQTSRVQGAEATARRVLRVVSEPFCWENHSFSLTCSVGVSIAPSHGKSLDELLRHAESAVRTAKQQGRATYWLYQAQPESSGQTHIALDHAMRQALSHGRFRLRYQPQVSLQDGSVLGAEALLRWRDAELGEVSPAQFIPAAEASGLIVALGDWVLSQAVRQAVLWHESGLDMPIAVNVSALQFRQSNFVERVASVLAVSGLPPHLLELELTESILVLDADEALRRLEALAKLGLRLSIDDFGTGYSSLAYLKRFPIAKLKIDGSFVKGLPADEGDAAIVQAILQMARALRLKVVAEGVETEAQREFLRDQGCDEFQGFLFAPALDPAAFETRIHDVRSVRAVRDLVRSAAEFPERVHRTQG